MAYVITQNCCKDASCVPVCPVDCIRPADDGDGFATAEMLYIDPETCIDCGACMEECPVDAIAYEEDLTDDQVRFKDINSAYFERHPLEPSAASSPSRHSPVPAGALRVAIVGAGPAACYAAADLVAVDGVQVNVFERLPTPFGLIRAGVAPDHQHTKAIVKLFEHAFASNRVGCYLNAEVGTTLTHDDLLRHHHAVVYATGATRGRELGIPGEDLPGVHAAADFVGWYNGHPDRARDEFDLTGRRAVIVGNGNVALDIARVLVMDRESLAATDIADGALSALADSSVDEVVVVARRELDSAAFSVGEFLALGHLDGVDVVIDSAVTEAGADDAVDTTLKIDIANEYRSREPDPAHKRIVFRFGVTPVEVVGDTAATGLRVAPTDGGPDEIIEAALILTSIGYRGSALTGVPHDAARGVVPNDGGRVTADDGAALPGVYVTGWIKRGPKGVIGTNRNCAAETVAALLADFDAGLLGRDLPAPGKLDELLAERGVSPLNWLGWQAINSHELALGAQRSRPRIKLVSVDELVAAARG